MEVSTSKKNFKEENLKTKDELQDLQTRLTESKKILDKLEHDEQKLKEKHTAALNEMKQLEREAATLENGAIVNELFNEFSQKLFDSFLRNPNAILKEMEGDESFPYGIRTDIASDEVTLHFVKFHTITCEAVSMKYNDLRCGPSDDTFIYHREKYDAFCYFSEFSVSKKIFE